MKKQIAVIAPEVFPIPPIKGGAVEHNIYNVAKLIPGYDQTIFSIHYDDLDLKNTEGTITHHRYKKTLLDKFLLLTYKLPFKRSNSFLYWRFYARWCAKICQRNDVQIICIYNRWQFVPIIRKLNPKARILLCFHQLSALNMSPEQSTLLQRQVDGFLGCSHFLINKIRERIGVEGKKISLIPGGTFIDKFFPIDDQLKKDLRKKYGFADEKIIMYSGRLVENKGAHVLVEAFNQMQNSNVKLLIVGGNTYSDQTKTEYIKRLKNLAAQSGEKVIFYGYVEQNKISDLYKISDIFAFPSQVEEALGLSLIEAMACGLAPVGSHRGGIGDLIEDGKNGFLVDKYNSSEVWSKKLNELLTSDKQCYEFGLESRKKVERSFSWQAVATQTQKIYDSLLKDKAS